MVSALRVERARYHGRAGTALNRNICPRRSCNSACSEISRDGSLTPRDLVGKLDVVVAECPKCSRIGRYGLRRLNEQRGRDRTIIDWLDALTADCPRSAPPASAISATRVARTCRRGVTVAPRRFVCLLQRLLEGTQLEPN